MNGSHPGYGSNRFEIVDNPEPKPKPKSKPKYKPITEPEPKPKNYKSIFDYLKDPENRFTTEEKVGRFTIRKIPKPFSEQIGRFKITEKNHVQETDQNQTVHVLPTIYLGSGKSPKNKNSDGKKHKKSKFFKFKFKNKSIAKKNE